MSKGEKYILVLSAKTDVVALTEIMFSYKFNFVYS